MALLQLLPEAHWDAMLLRMFPGKALEDLDGMDWPRLMRALQVQEIERMEELHDLFLAGKYKPQPHEWQRILRNNRLDEQVIDG